MKIYFNRYGCFSLCRFLDFSFNYYYTRFELFEKRNESKNGWKDKHDEIICPCADVSIHGRCINIAGVDLGPITYVSGETLILVDSSTNEVNREADSNRYGLL